MATSGARLTRLEDRLAQISDDDLDELIVMRAMHRACPIDAHGRSMKQEPLDSADAYREVAEKLRATAEATREIARALIALSAALRREADTDPNAHSAKTRRFQADLAEREAAIAGKEATTRDAEARRAEGQAATAESRLALPDGSSFFDTR